MSGLAAPHAATAPLLAVRDLHAGFRTTAGLVRAVDGVSLTLPPGGSLGIVGESGSGKSALALCLMRLLPRSAEVSGGGVDFAGQDLLALDERAMRRVRGRRIAMVFQDPLTSLNPYLRVGEQVAEQVRLHLGLDRRAARARVVALFDQMGIPEPATSVDRYPHQMSGGQRQRVLIAMALSCDPELLIADEPTTALDVTIQAQILALIRVQQRQRRMGLILVTHDLGVVAGMCERVAVMYAGQVVEEATVAELFADPRHPYTRGLIAARPRLDGDQGQPLQPIPGQPPRLSGARTGCAFAPRCAHAEERCRAEVPGLRALSSGSADGAGRAHRCLFDLPPAPAREPRAATP